MILDYITGAFMLGVMLSLMVVGILISVFMPGISKLNKKFFALLFGDLTLLIILITVDSALYFDSTMATAQRIFAFWEYFFCMLIMPLFTAYLLRCCGENLRNKLFYAVITLFVIFLILLGIAQFTKIFYYVSDENLFYRGEWHFFLALPAILMMFFNIFGVIRRKKILSKKYFVAFLIHLLPMTLAVIVHAITYSEFWLSFGIIFSESAMFIIILSDQVEEFFRQQREIDNQQTNILILQMRPHFVYNTMTSIYYLCAQNPEKAQKVILDFTNYLRKNFTAIACAETISFSEELEHTKAYLSIEKVQFEEILFVTYDTPHINFKIPPLTLQPIVENSVKHGLDPDSNPLHILISTRETESGSIIIVEDDGTGFKIEDTKENFALQNIQKRLEIFCNGNLIISPREGGGTVVKILIPPTKK